MRRGCEIKHFDLINKEDFFGFSGVDFFVISRGGVWAGEDSVVLRPSDVVDGISLEKLLRNFDVIPGSTVIHVREAIKYGV